MKNPITLYLMRHGELENTDVLAGRTDLALSEVGLKNMKDALSSLNISQCISSPLSRCLSVSKKYCAQHNFDIVIEAQIQEFDFGDWDGKSFKQLWSMSTPTIGDFWQNPRNITPPNGESYQMFEHRISNWWQTFLAELSTESDNTLIVSHAGVIKLILANILHAEDSAELLNKLKVSYASPIKISVFIEGNKRWASLAL